MPRLFSSLLLSLLLASSASASMAWTPVGNPGNACDPQFGGPSTSNGCFGSVGYSYYIGTYEVTNAQYVEFLNAKAAADSLGLYNTAMGSGFGGITRTGVSGSFRYSAVAGREHMPVNYVSFYDTLRFANWMNNGQGAADTETGAYTLLGGTATPSNGSTLTRNAGATIVLTSEDEWYKAAYHNAIGLAATDYFDYPAGSNTQTTCAAPTVTANRANCGNAVGNFTAAGSYTGSPSPYGTYDQGGNVWERNEAIISGSFRGARGGSFDSFAFFLPASFRSNTFPSDEVLGVGFRLAMIPEPGTGLLVIAGLLGLAGWRRSSGGRATLDTWSSSSSSASPKARSRRRPPTKAGSGSRARAAPRRGWRTESITLLRSGRSCSARISARPPARAAPGWPESPMTIPAPCPAASSHAPSGRGLSLPLSELRPTGSLDPVRLFNEIR